MTSEVEAMIADALRSREGGTIDVAFLHTVASRRGRAIRRRRSMLAAGGLAVVVLVGVFTVPMLSMPGPTGKVPQYYLGPPAALPAADVPGAAERPDLIGTDPAVLHFDVDTTGLRGLESSWVVQDGLESLELSQFRYGQALVGSRFYVSRSAAQPDPGLLPDPAALDAMTPEQVVVAGRPGVVQGFTSTDSRTDRTADPTWTLKWQPADRVWAVITMIAPDVGSIIAAGQALRLNRAQRCVAPAVLSTIPPGSRWTGCGIVVGPAIQGPTAPGPIIPRLTTSGPAVHGSSAPDSTTRAPTGPATPPRASTHGSGPGPTGQRTSAQQHGGWLRTVLTLTLANGSMLQVGIGDIDDGWAVVADRMINGRPAQLYQTPGGANMYTLQVPGDTANPTVFVWGPVGDAELLIQVASGLVWAEDQARPEAWALRAIPTP